MQQTLDLLVDTVGEGRLKLIHANDSKDVVGAHKDRHENIGAGHIGEDPFRELLPHPATDGRTADHRDARRQGGARGGRGAAEGAAGRSTRIRIGEYPRGYTVPAECRNRYPTLGVIHEQHDARTHATAGPPRRTRTRHATHATTHDTGRPGSWAMAAQATLHCLTGCAIGEVLGMVIGTALGWGNMPTTVLAIVLAFFFGYSLTLRGVLRAGVDFRTAFRVALAADTLSIAVMELIDNGVIALWPGAMDAHLADVLFWVVAARSRSSIAFVVTTPVNKWMIGRGKGHAVVHQYHH